MADIRFSGKEEEEATQPASLATYYREINRIPLLSREEEMALGKRARSGDRRAIDRLVSANLRFVVSVARRYANYGLPLEDLINEGNVGLIKAAERFDERRGNKFISYAVWWIRQAMLQSLSKHSRVVRLPLNRTNVLHRVTKIARKLTQSLGRAPHAGEIASELGLKEAEVREAIQLTTTTVSLDEPVAGDPDGEALIDLLSTETPDGPDASVNNDAFRRQVRKALATLDERQREILIRYFGLGGHEPQTLEAIGRSLGLTRERIRQIKEDAIARLRHSSRAAFFDDYVRRQN